MALIFGLIAFVCIFIFFLVLGKTLNNTINHLVKIQYLLQKEYDLKKERVAIAQLLEEEKNKPGPEEDAPQNGGDQAQPVDNSSSVNNNKKR